jgi:CBS domain-containing protein
MHRARVGSMVIADAAERPLGIFTQPDALARVALPQAPMSTPISGVMTANPVTLEEEATLADAAIAMARHGIRHVVVTRGGRLTGVVSERDLFALQRVTLSRTSQRIHSAATLDELVAAAGDVRRLTRQLLAQGVAAEHLTAMASALNDALSQRLIAIAAARHALQGRWCWIALGSEGRMEQTFATDQDNALIYAGEPGAQAELLAFAGEVNAGLAACGFPLCPGNIMARNPRWCLTLDAWRGVFREWIHQPAGEALLNASIFFDFRPLAGDARLAGELREQVFAMVKARSAFWCALAENALRIRLPLGVVRDFSTSEPIDLKLYGALPFVEAARVFALAHGIAETGTAARLRAAARAGAFSLGDAQAAITAFHYVQALRLKRQALEQGDSNRVAAQELNTIDRRVLKEALRQAAMLQDVLRMSYR